jgi:hypothetical protein
VFAFGFEFERAEAARRRGRAGRRVANCKTIFHYCR